MSRISREIIEQVRQAADILDIISGVVNLKKRGQNYFGICPFHNEKTPSFSVAPAKEIYHCFGCNAGGNVFHFLMEYEKMTFVEAVQSLGSRYGIEVKFSGDVQNQEELQRLRDLHTSTTNFYKSLLRSAEGKQVVIYLKKRGLSEKTIKEFQLGFAPEAWDRLLKLSRENGVSGNILDKSGLFTKTEKGVFDRFRNRLMFPIHNSGGQVIAFGGRTMDSEDPAKYMNSPETVLYSKSRVFYGLDKTQKVIRKEKTAILVEGYMDFLQLYQGGIKNIIAVAGTAFTENHVYQMKKLAQKILLMYDGDSAGKNAAVRAGYLLMKGGMEPFIIPVPDGLDPDDWIRQEGVDAIKNKLNSGIPIINFHIHQSQGKNMSPAEKSNFIREVVKEVVGIQDRIFRNEMLRLVSDEMKVNENDLLIVAEKESKKEKKWRVKKHEKNENREFSSRNEKAQLELVKLLAGESLDVRQQVRNSVKIEYFTSPILKKLAQFFFSNYEDFNYSSVIQLFESKEEREVVAEILLNLSQTDEVDRTIQDCVNSLKVGSVKRSIDEARIRLREKEREGSDVSEILFEISELRKKLGSLSIGSG